MNINYFFNINANTNFISFIHLFIFIVMFSIIEEYYPPLLKSINNYPPLLKTIILHYWRVLSSIIEEYYPPLLKSTILHYWRV